ncbi:MAG: 4-hydroxy-tetrahydrodipicolinate reductase [Spirochaetales bacterium]|nr:4-hydroxy-tetrahydrodipicolinate reductase [Spirochaetales bacterium]
MKVLIVGYGNMGKEVEKALVSRGHSVAGRIDVSGNADATTLDDKWLSSCDGVIEFSLRDAVLANAQLYATAGVPAVTGTTGCLDLMASISSMVEQHNSSYMYGTNFSLGAHIFFRLAEAASSFVNKIPEYDFMLHEYHHKHKKDSPSGTALSAAERILNASTRKDTIVPSTLDRAILPNELHVSSTRGGAIPGIHTFTLDSDEDTVIIEHSARNRHGFATGAVKALEWLIGRKGFYTVDSFIDEILGGSP